MNAKACTSGSTSAIRSRHAVTSSVEVARPSRISAAASLNPSAERLIRGVLQSKTGDRSSRRVEIVRQPQCDPWENVNQEHRQEHHEDEWQRTAENIGELDPRR